MSGSCAGRQRAEVRVGRQKDSVLISGQVEDLSVLGALHPEVAQVDGVMAGVGEDMDEVD